MIREVLRYDDRGDYFSHDILDFVPYQWVGHGVETWSPVGFFESEIDFIRRDADFTLEPVKILDFQARAIADDKATLTGVLVFE
jgi:hypothetical protein